MRFIDAGAIDAALDQSALIQALAYAFRGGAQAPPRHHHTIPRPDGNATLLMMPAWTEGGDAHLGVKLVTVYPGNPRRALPTVIGTYLLMDGASGAPLAAMDGTRLTLWRTAAASALAARSLAKPDARRMVMVGAGALAPFLIRAHRSVRPLTDIAIWNRNPAKAEQLAADLAAEGLPVWAVTDLAAAVAEADIVSCATLSTEALVHGAWLRPGTHLDLVGAFAPGMREVDDAAILASTLFIDTPAALREGGDIQGAVAAGLIGEDRIAGDLAALARGDHPGRTSADEITLFKSIGAAIEDLAAARLVWMRVAAA